MDAGNDGTLSVSNSTINLQGSSTITVNGSNDTLVGGNSDTFNIYGSDNSVSASNSTVNFPDGDSGDSVSGDDDGGTGWTQGHGTGGPGTGGPGTGGPGSGSGSGSGFAGSKLKVAHTLGVQLSKAKFDFDSGKTRNSGAFAHGEAEVRQAIAHEEKNEVLNGGKWNTQTVTWSMADPSGASAAQKSAYEAAAQQALSAWSLATGLEFEEISNPSHADIQFTWGDLDTQDTGRVGNTVYSEKNGQMQAGVSITLEDPAQDRLADDSSGQLTYAGTQATLQQVLEHEIGHALGFADNDNPKSIMDYYLGEQNLTLSGADVAAATALYGSGGSGMTGTASSHSAIQLDVQFQKTLQASASFGGNDSAASAIETVRPIALQQHEPTLAASHR